MDDLLTFIIIFCGIGSLLGIIFSIVGISVLNSRKRKEKICTSKTFGKVNNLIRHEDYSSDGSSISNWHPIFEYNIGELKFIKESIYGNSQAKYAIGQTVELYYNPEDYNEYYVPSETLPKKLGKIFTIVGLTLLCICILVFIIFLLLNQ